MYARRYHHSRDLSRFFRLALGKDQKRMAMAALANLSKFLGCYGYWRNWLEMLDLDGRRRSV